MSISIGYLSWKRHDIFNQTLESHKQHGLFELIEPANRFIYFQEISQDDINIARKYECNYMGGDTNIGILNAFLNLVDACTTEYFIFSENDWLLIENKIMTQQILKDGIELFKTNACDIIKLRHSIVPGNPLYSMPTNKFEWKLHNQLKFPYKLESISWIDDLTEYYGDNIIKPQTINNSKWFVTTLQHQKWSNNIFMATTSYLKKCVVPLLLSCSHENQNKYLSLEFILVNYLTMKNGINDELIDQFNMTKIATNSCGLFTHKDKININNIENKV